MRWRGATLSSRNVRPCSPDAEKGSCRMKIDNVADLIAETLAQAGVKRIFGVVGDSLKASPTRCASERRSTGFTSGMKRSPPSPLRAKRRSRASCGLRRVVRPRQSASHQRPVRCAPQPHAGAGDCRADSVGRNRRRLFSETHPQDLFRECSHYCELISDPARCHSLRMPFARPWGGAALPSSSSPATSRSSSAEARHLAECRAAARAANRPAAEGELEALANSSTAPSASRCSAAAAVPAPMTA